MSEPFVLLPYEFSYGTIYSGSLLWIEFRKYVITGKASKIQLNEFLSIASFDMSLYENVYDKKGS